MSDATGNQSTRSPGHDIYTRWHVRHRKTLLVVGVIFVTCIASWIVSMGWFGGVKTYTGDDSIAAASRGVEVRADTATVHVLPSTDGRVHLKIRGEYSGAVPFMALTVEDERVLAVVNCHAEPMRHCDLTAELRMPADQSLEAKSSSGLVDVRKLAGRVQVRTDDGPINLGDLDGSLVVQTLTGRVSGTNLSGPRYTVTTRDAPISLGTTVVPASVMVRTGGSQPVTLTVPAGRYRLQMDTGQGKVNLGRGIVRDQNSTAFITVATEGAPVALRVVGAS